MFYGFPSEDNYPGEVKVAFHFVGESTQGKNIPVTPDSLDREVHTHEIDAMRDAIKSRIPAMNNELLRTVTCMYTTTPDGHL